jgi:anaerobic magnesium-protoporphyrin IX monomethyl ester cyclase
VILFVNPRATRPENRRFPLSLMAVGAALPGDVSWEIIDGNLPGIDVVARVASLVEAQQSAGDPVTTIALTVMPGPQLVSAVPVSKAIKARFPHIPIVWGGNFGSLYPDPVLNAPYVDWLVRGQGEDSFLELLEAIAGRRDPATIPGIAYRLSDGAHHLAPERVWRGPN